MKYFIFRNNTVENLFQGFTAEFSGYDDISSWNEEADIFVWFYQAPIVFSNQDLAAAIRHIPDKIQLVANRIKKPFVVLTIECFFENSWVNADRIVRQAVVESNQLILELEEKLSNVYVVDFSEFSGQIEKKVDWRYYYISQSIISPSLAKRFAGWFQQKIAAILSGRKKCLVLDLDNTLWGGVLGEDGITGIQLGNTYPGNAFRDFQLGILEAARHGVILTICSKNNETDVIEAWEKHPGMIISKNQVSAYRINWNDKVTNIIELAEELNIGLDSMVFIDDNPVERGRVREFLPAVGVPEFPQKPYMLPDFIRSVYANYFQQHRLTKEDISKTDQYISNAKRREHKRTFADLDEYLASLDMKLSVQFADKILIPRIAQMTQKTNQFNLTTRRYSETHVVRFVEEGAWVIGLSVEDKFGDNGVTVASIIKIDRDAAIALIDSFLLSCRILGRGIEVAFLTFCLNLLFKEGIKKVNGTFIPTKKNGQARNFLENNGFKVIGEHPDGSKEYELELTGEIPIKPYYNFVIR